MYHIKTKKLPKILPSLLGYALVLTELGPSRPRLDYTAVCLCLIDRFHEFNFEDLTTYYWTIKESILRQQ